MLTKDALARLWPRAAPALIDAMVAAAPTALPRFAITTPLRLAMLLAMATVESAGGTRMAEDLKDYSADRLRQVWPHRFNAVSARLAAHKPEAIAERVYGGRLGNRPGTGDAFLFRGGGLPQLTGRDTYAAVGTLAGLDLVTTPDLARDPGHALDLLCAFFAWKDLGEAADRGDVARVTHRWSGGLDSLVQRQAAYRAALAALGAEVPAEPEGAGVGMDDEGYEVEAVQKRLGVLGYHCGAPDGHFGSLTRASLLAFQADNRLPTSGRADAATKAALAADNPRLVAEVRANATPATLAGLGSATVRASQQLQKAAVVAIGAGGLFGTGSATGSIDGVKGLVDKANGLRDTVTAVQEMAGFVGTHWWAVAIVAGALLYGRASTIIAARVADHRAAANLGA